MLTVIECIVAPAAPVVIRPNPVIRAWKVRDPARGAPLVDGRGRRPAPPRPRQYVLA